MFEAAEEDESVIGSAVAAQREEVEREIAGLQTEARAREEETEGLVGSSPFHGLVPPFHSGTSRCFATRRGDR